MTVTYGVNFGTPTNVSWYKNGKVVATNSVGDDVNEALSTEIPAGGRWGVGTYKVTITNTDGDMATTNEIVITDKEEAATIVGFEIEDDYTDGTGITYNAQDSTAVATVTLNKNYAGTIRIYKKSDTKYTARVDQVATTTAGALRTAAVATADAAVLTRVDDGESELCTTPATNYQVLNANQPGSAYGHINDDGSVTYKFQVNGGALTRGTEYVVTFDQTSISTDTPGTGKANVYEEAVAVPYVQVPASIAVTKVSAGNRPEVTFYGEDGGVLEWLGTPTTTSANFDTLGECGIASAQIYSATIKTNDTSKGTALGAATTNSIAQGVWTSGTEAPSPIDAYWFAQVKTTAGVYGSGQVTLLSEPTPAAQDSASDMDLIENKDTATTATVSFSNLRSDGTVYIVRGYWDLATNGALNTATGTYNNTGIAVTNHATTVANIFAGFDRDDSTTYVASAAVTAGTEKVNIENAISKVTTNSVSTPTTAGDKIEGLTIGTTDASAVASGKHFNNNYIAVFIPDDEVNYGMIYTDGALGAPTSSSTNSTVGTDAAKKSPLQITQALAKYSLASLSNNDGSLVKGGTAYANVNGALSATVASADKALIVMKDQFGETLNPTGTTYDKIWTFKTSNSEGVQDNAVTLSWDAVGTAKDEITINVTTGTELGTGIPYFKAGEKYTATTSTNQTITLEVKTAAATAGDGNNTNDNNPDTTTKWVISIS